MDELEARTRERDRLASIADAINQDNQRIRNRLRQLTPGGSEFMDTDRCLDWIAERLHAAGTLAAELAATRARCAELEGIILQHHSWTFILSTYRSGLGSSCPICEEKMKPPEAKDERTI